MDTTDEPTPRTEHASDALDGEALEEYLSKPGAMIGRVECQHLDRDGDTMGWGQTMVSTMMLRGHYPEALLHDVPPVWLTSHIPWIGTGGPPTGLGAAMLEPVAARALARYLLEGADRAEPPTGKVRSCLECGDRMGDDDLYDDFHVFSGQQRHQVRCECGVSGPACLTRAGAIARWNGMMDRK